jgi:hypothetical protein
MIVLELRDPSAGVLAHSYHPNDCVHFLRRCLNQKRKEAASLQRLDPFAAAVVGAEVARLQQLLDLLCGKEMPS